MDYRLYRTYLSEPEFFYFLYLNFRLSEQQKIFTYFSSQNRKDYKICFHIYNN